MISVAIITHNEEDNIRDALESVKWADEIVVVDSFSTDRTREICKGYTDKVYSIEWSGFAEQKNKAVSLTTYPWVLVLDADECVTEGLRNEILGVMGEGAGGRVDGYYISRKNYFGNRWIKHGGWWPDYTLRLFRREKGSFQMREVHESVKVNGKIGRLKNSLEHYTYKDINDYLKRMQTYSTLSAKELFKKGRRANIFDIIFRPCATFFRMFFLQMGILDGIYGIILAYMSSIYTFNKYFKLWKMVKKG
jgi:glycosyltransferase involved in cell wall biosynthesis